MQRPGDAYGLRRPPGSTQWEQWSQLGRLDGEALADALSEDVDVPAALEAYEDARRERTSRLVLANRAARPNRVMQWMRDGCDGACRDHHACVPIGDLERAANAYKELAVFDLATLQALSWQPNAD